MDHFRLHDQLPPLDPDLVAASAREHAEAHLRLPIVESRIFFIDRLEGMQCAREVLRSPPLIGEEPSGDDSGSGGRRMSGGVSCVGLDVESSPTTNKAAILQASWSCLMRLLIIRSGDVGRKKQHVRRSVCSFFDIGMTHGLCLGQ